jgi:hypothetical protein
LRGLLWCGLYFFFFSVFLVFFVLFLFFYSFFYFFQSVLSLMCTQAVTRGLLAVADTSGDAGTVLVMRVLHRLSSSADFLEAVHGTGAVPTLVRFLSPGLRAQGGGAAAAGQSAGQQQQQQQEQQAAASTYVADVQSHALGALLNLVAVDRRLQDEAATAGAVPHLLAHARDAPALRECSLRILCAMVRASKNARNLLWQHNAMELYLDVLREEAWRANAMDAVNFWVNDEPGRVSARLERADAIEAMVDVFRNTPDDRFVEVVEKLDSIVSASERVGRAFGQSGFVEILKTRMAHPEAIVRVTLIRILKSLYLVHPNPKEMIARFRLFEFIQGLRERDQSVLLVKNMAEQLLGAFHANVVM